MTKHLTRDLEGLERRLLFLAGEVEEAVRRSIRALLDRRIEELIHEFKGEYSILIVTHNMQQASRTSDYTAFMYLGRLIEYGPTAEIFRAPRLRETEDYVTGRFG